MAMSRYDSETPKAYLSVFVENLDEMSRLSE